MLDAQVSHHTGRCRNVSQSGLAVDLSAHLPVGIKLEVYFELPNGVGVEITAQVVRCTGDEVALHFVDMNAELLFALRSFCESYAGQLAFPAADDRLSVH
jgi:hypothetical protein